MEHLSSSYARSRTIDKVNRVFNGLVNQGIVNKNLSKYIQNTLNRDEVKAVDSGKDLSQEGNNESTNSARLPE